ncbi:MAG: branched-chain amino acid ABC transporter permease [Armatimonadota bacterium]
MDSLPDIVQLLITGLAQGSIYAIVAIGFTIVFSSTEIVNFAQGEFVMLGAMSSYWLVVEHQWPLYLAIPVAIFISMIVGMALGWVLMRPLKNASPVSLIIITVGASMLMQGVASQIWGKDPLNLPPFTEGSPVIFSLPKWLTNNAVNSEVFILPQQLWVMGLTAVIVLGLTLFFNRTIIGKALRAVAVNRHGARLVGINVSRMVIGAFALSAAIGAVAGASIAPISSGYYNMGTMIGLKGFAAAIVGGLGNFPGSIIAGLLLGVLESLGAGYISSDYKDALAFIILLLMLVISPTGILAWRRRRVK